MFCAFLLSLRGEENEGFASYFCPVSEDQDNHKRV